MKVPISTPQASSVPFMDRMLTLDCIITNGDRHFNNFGILRDPGSLE